jgi:glutamine synthetase
METILEIAAEHEDLARRLHQEGVEYVFASFVDVTGRLKSKCVPVAHLPALIAGHERYTPRGLGSLGQMTPDEDECVAIPDPATLCVLPWDRRMAHMAADLWFGGREPFAHCTRSILKRQVARAAAAGYGMVLGVETELYAVQTFDPSSSSTGYLEPYRPSGRLRPTAAYDVDSTLDMTPFLVPMVEAMQECGFGVFSFDHEGGDGQVEFDFAPAPPVEMADRLALFRLMAKQIAKQAGLAVTFMPKPYTEAWGSGAHFNMSLVDIDGGENLFRDPEDHRGRGWSKVAYGFVAGILRHAPALAAICTPTVNSYKRLQPRLSDGTVSWAPTWAAYGDNNRSCLLRLPRNRPAVENRGVDSAANPYLTAAFLLAAGLEGVLEGADPGPPVEDLVYDWTTTGPASSGEDRPHATRLPRNLLEAIDAFTADPLTHQVFPARFVEAYAEMKLREWDDYHSQVTDWERRTYLGMF